MCIKKVPNFGDGRIRYQPERTYIHPVLVEHLKYFRYLGSNPLVLEMGRLSEISKPYFGMILCFLILHTIYFVYHLKELESKAPFSTALGMFRRSAFALGPVLSFYKFVKNRAKIGKALEDLVAIQQVFGIENYKVFWSIKLLGAMALCTACFRFWTGFMAATEPDRVSDAIKMFDSAVLMVYIFGCVANFTYLVKCVTSCVKHLCDFGLKTSVDEPSIRRYVKVYSHLVSIAEELNSHFDACVSFCFLAWFLNVMDSTSDLLDTKGRDTLANTWKLLKLGIGVSGILHVVTTGQTATDTNMYGFGMDQNGSGNRGTELSARSMSKPAARQDPAIVRHLRVFQYFGSSPLTLKIGRFKEISKPFFALTLGFVIFHTAFFIYHLTELENEAPFRTALGVFRRTVFSLGTALPFYIFVKNRFLFGTTLDKLIAAQQMFGVTKYNMFLPISLYTVFASAASAYRFAMGLTTMLQDRREYSEAVKRLESAMLTVLTFSSVSSFTYLVKCNSACVRRLSECGLKNGVDEPRIRRYIETYDQLVSISEGINSYYDAFMSFAVLGSFLNMMDSTSDLLSTEELDPVVSVWVFFKVTFGLFGILLLVVPLS